MTVTLQQLQHWLTSREDEHLEFKEAKQNFHFDKLVKYCAALANEGGGSIVLGVTDRRPLVSGKGGGMTADCLAKPNSATRMATRHTPPARRRQQPAPTTVERRIFFYPTLWRVFTATIRALAFAAVASLVALIADREKSPAAWALYGCVLGILFVIARLSRCVWVLEQVTHLVATAPSEEQKS
jgi:hypothetical protein